LTIRVQPDLPTHIKYNATAIDEEHKAAWELVRRLDQFLPHAIAKAAKVRAGAVVFLAYDAEGFPRQWQIEPLLPGIPAPE
jgi:hypothetical protein